jgi:hypothetical protein
MRNTPYLFALAAIGSLAFVAPSTSASPLASGLALPAPEAGSVLKVQAWSCQEKRRDMTLKQRRFCDGYYDDYDDYGDYGPGYGYAYPAPGYGYGYPAYGLGVPFLSFEFDGGRRHHRHRGNWD